MQQKKRHRRRIINVVRRIYDGGIKGGKDRSVHKKGYRDIHEDIRRRITQFYKRGVS